MPVTSQLTSLIDFSGTPTLPGYGGGQGAAINADVVIEGAQSAGRRVDNTTNKGFGGNFTAADLSGAGEHVKAWVFVTQWPSVTKVQLRISSGSDDDHELPTGEYPALGGFIPLWADVSRAPEAGGSANEASINEVGVLLDIGDVGGNAPNLILDEVMHGTSGLKWTGTGGEMQDFRDYEATNNEGNLVTLNGIDFLYSRLETGDTTADTFSDSGFTVICPDQSLVAVDFMGWTLRGTDTLSDATFGSANPLNAGRRPDLICEGANTLSGMNLPGLRLLQLNSTSSLENGSNALVVELTQAGGAISDSTLRVLTASGVAVCDDFTVDDTSGLSVVQAGSGHFVDLGTIASSTSITWTVTSTGFPAGVTGSPAATTSAGDEVVLCNVASGQTLTINVAAGATTPSVKNDGAGDVAVIVPEVTVTFTNMSVGGEFRIYDDDGDGNAITIGTNREGVESLSGTTYVLTHPSSEDGNIIFAQFMSPLTFEEQVVEVTLSTVNQTVPFDLTPEENI